MAQRTIQTGVGGYLAPNGMQRIASLGDVVEVADSDLERFDSVHGPVDQPETRKPGRPRKTEV